jgi:hypothetical protein
VCHLTTPDPSRSAVEGELQPPQQRLTGARGGALPTSRTLYAQTVTSVSGPFTVRRRFHQDRVMCRWTFVGCDETVASCSKANLIITCRPYRHP